MLRSLLAVACLIGTLVPVKPIPVQSTNTQTPALTVTIATTGTFLGPPSSKFKVGDQIPVSITMTNDTPVLSTVCISSNLYQNVPRLTKEGKIIPYINWEAYEQKSTERNQVCQRENLPQSIAIGPRESKLTDWFVLVDSTIATGAEAWYEQLTPGKYELSIQRRINCCDGPMVESNKISFEVTL